MKEKKKAAKDQKKTTIIESGILKRPHELRKSKIEREKKKSNTSRPMSGVRFNSLVLGGSHIRPSFPMRQEAKRDLKRKSKKKKKK